MRLLRRVRDLILTFVYSGRGRTPSQRPSSFLVTANVTADNSEYFLRDQGKNAIDGVAFHYSTYRSLTRFLGMDGNLAVAYDVDVNFVQAWQTMFLDNDFLNANTGDLDPRHMYGTSNFDVFRWPSLENGTQRGILGSFISYMVMPGVPLVSSCSSFSVTRLLTLAQIYYGEEQNIYLYDTSAQNYLYGYVIIS